MKRLGIVAMAVAALACAPAGAVTAFNFQGQPFNREVGGATLTGPITGSITFAAMPLVAGSELTEADVVDFSFSTDGFTMTLAEASFFDASFSVDTPTQLSGYSVFIEQEVSTASNVGPEQISLVFEPTGFSLESFVFGDNLPNESSSATSLSGRFFQFSGAEGGFSIQVVPLPAPFLLLGAGIAGLLLVSRKRAG